MSIEVSAAALKEALPLADEILRDIELSQISLSMVMLKASRLARLVGASEYQVAFEYEASGYPSEPDGVPADVFGVARLSGRVYKSKDKDGSVVERANIEAVEIIEQRITTSRIALEAARDPNVSVSSSNPNQYVWSPSGNSLERTKLQTSIANDTRLLAGRRSFVHRYVSRTYDELRFSSIAGDIFSRLRSSVDSSIGRAVPKSVQKFALVYENLSSDNPGNRANAVHSCRRILQDLADVVFAPRADVVVGVGSKQRAIKLGPDNYINRLVAFIEENSTSERFTAIVGSTLAFVGDRLDAAFQAAQKGSHGEISSREEADRYVVYTYMLVADILSLRPLGEAPQITDGLDVAGKN